MIDWNPTYYNMRLVILFCIFLSSPCHCEVDWCKLPCERGDQHTMCVYKAHTNFKDCKNMMDSLTPTSRKDILHLHNKYRDELANGEKGNWPKAANMRQMSWDEVSESISLRWNQQCTPGHDVCRRTEEFPYVGQNYGMGGDSVEYPSNNISFDGWVDEIKLIQDPKSMVANFKGGKWGHFTQVIWAESFKLGCSEIHTTQNKYFTMIVICNYGPGGNMNTAKMYIEGEPCSKCPNGTQCRKDSEYPHLCALESDVKEPVDIAGQSCSPSISNFGVSLKLIFPVVTMILAI